MTSSFRPSTEEPTGGTSPILDVIWTLHDWKVDERVFPARRGMPARKTQTVVFNFIDLDILKIAEGAVHPLPTAQVRIPYVEPKETRKPREGEATNRWEAWSSSGRSVFGRAPDLDEFLGKRQRWSQVPVILRVPNPDPAPDPDSDEAATYELFVDHEELAWKVVEVEGVGVSSGNGVAGRPDPLMAYILALAENETPTRFYEKAMDDDKVMASPSTITELTSGTYVDRLISDKLLRLDEAGLLHAV